MIREFLITTGRIFGAILVVIFMVVVLIGSAGAFGWPTHDPIWMLLTVPAALLVDAAIVAGALTWYDHSGGD